MDFFEKALGCTADVPGAWKDVVPRIPNLRGVKHTTPSLSDMQLLVARYGRRVDVVLGSDETYLEGLAIGVDGNVVQSYDGLALGRVKDAFDRGDLTAARRDQVPASDALVDRMTVAVIAAVWLGGGGVVHINEVCRSHGPTQPPTLSEMGGRV